MIRTEEQSREGVSSERERPTLPPLTQSTCHSPTPPPPLITTSSSSTSILPRSRRSGNLKGASRAQSLVAMVMFISGAVSLVVTAFTCVASELPLASTVLLCLPGVVLLMASLGVATYGCRMGAPDAPPRRVGCDVRPSQDVMESEGWLRSMTRRVISNLTPESRGRCGLPPAYANCFNDPIQVDDVIPAPQPPPAYTNLAFIEDTK